MSTQVKKVLKKKVTVNQTEEVAPVVENAEPVEVAAPVTINLVEESFIPSSRVHNYVSCSKLNKEFDETINKIKADGFASAGLSQDEVEYVNSRVSASAEDNVAINNSLARVSAGEDLSSILSVDDQKKVGELIAALEAKNAKAADADKQAIDIKEITTNLLTKRLVTHDVAAVELISKKRFKFSKESFDVLATFSDIVVCEITKFALDRLVEVGNSTIEPKYIFSSNVHEGELYGYYSNLPSYKKAEVYVKESEAQKEALKKAKKEANKKAKKGDTGDETEEQEPAETEEQDTVDTETDDKKINFKFYIKSIVYKLKETKPEYANAKVSDRFQTLCSDIVLDILDDAVALSQIILNVMTTKTISSKLFKSCIYTKIYDLAGYENVKAVLDAKYP